MCMYYLTSAYESMIISKLKVIKICETNYEIILHNFIFHVRFQPFSNNFHAMELIKIKIDKHFLIVDYSTLIEINS